MQIAEPGVVQELAPGLRRLLAPNPSAFTGPGSFVHLLGEGRLVVIDPGPDLPAHRAGLMAALAGARVEAILITHPHADHSGAAGWLAQTTGAEVIGFGPAGSGRSAAMARLAGLEGGEGLDKGFAPDRCVTGGVVRLAAGAVEVLHTPGHSAEHLTFGWEGRLFVGDTVMAWAPSLISPPDGCMTAYMDSLARLEARVEPVWHPTHGAALAEPQARLAELMAHRRARGHAVEAALAEAAGLAGGAVPIAALLPRVYADLSPALHPAAARNLLAHLIALHGEGRATAQPAPGPAALWHPA